MENLITNIKKVSLTPEEKSRVFLVLNKYAEIGSEMSKEMSNEKSRKQEPDAWNIFAWKQIQSYKALSYTFASFFLLVLMGGATVYASESALPGDILYPVKIHVSEKLRLAVARTHEKKEEIQVEIIEERLKEAEVLALEERLTKDVSEKLKKSFEDKTQAVREKLSKKNREDLDIKISAHSIILKSIKEHSDDDQKENIEDIEGAVIKDKGIVKDINAEKGENDKSFSERKMKVEKVIEDARKKIKENLTNEGSFEHNILNNASSSIRAAENYLKEAQDWHNKNNKKESDRSILDSEKNAKEASISVTRSLELSKIKKDYKQKNDKKRD